MPKNVLLADDSITIQRVVELTFANQDVTVVSVRDGSQAIESIRQQPPDLVLADIGMPGRSGYEVVEFVRSQPHLAALPVLLLAGAFEQVDEAQAHLVGADGILIKPFDPAVLIGRVNELLATGRAAFSAVHPQPVSVPGAAAFTPAAQRRQQDPIASLDGAVEAPSLDSFADLSGTAADDDLPPSADAPPVAAAPQAAEVPPGPAPEVDRYFDQLDQAFAELTKAPRPPMPVVDEALPADDDETPGSGEGGHSDLPAVAPASAPTLPLTDAFAALLDAERTGTVNPPIRRRPVAASVPTLIDVDALAEQIARRVLEQLTDRVVRDTVAEIATSTAERLVREEIERIKRNIK